MDAFYASIEQRDHPEYRGKPIVVGGDPFGRGVVSTASYEARKFGIHSAMPAAQARRLCPKAIFLRPNFEQYQRDSEKIMNILAQYTDLMEPVSLDEAYLDVTKNRLSIEDPILLATMIKQNIFAVTQLTASAGVAPNMFLAKISSDMKKPDGLTVIRPEEVQAFLKDLPVRKIPGIGPVTEKILVERKIFTCGELAEQNSELLHDILGKSGLVFKQMARGIDEREVEPNLESKQYSTEETFTQDTKDTRRCEEKLKNYAQDVFSHLKEEGRMGKTVVLKVKYFDFEQITRSKTLDHLPSGWEEIYNVARELLEQKTLAGTKPIRLLGLGLSNLIDVGEKKKPVQKNLF
jgi:DNA polymerase-4